MCDTCSVRAALGGWAPLEIEPASSRAGEALTPDMVCMICEVNVPGEDLWALHFDPGNPRSALWLHPECVDETNYYRE